MSAAFQRVRIRLPRPLFKKLAAQAEAEKTDVKTLLVKAVAIDLRVKRIKKTGRR